MPQARKARGGSRRTAPGRGPPVRRRLPGPPVQQEAAAEARSSLPRNGLANSPDDRVSSMRRPSVRIIPSRLSPTVQCFPIPLVAIVSRTSLEGQARANEPGRSPRSFHSRSRNAIPGLLSWVSGVRSTTQRTFDFPGPPRPERRPPRSRSAQGTAPNAAASSTSRASGARPSPQEGEGGFAAHGDRPAQMTRGQDDGVGKRRERTPARSDGPRRRPAAPPERAVHRLFEDVDVPGRDPEHDDHDERRHGGPHQRRGGRGQELQASAGLVFELRAQAVQDFRDGPGRSRRRGPSGDSPAETVPSCGTSP